MKTFYAVQYKQPARWAAALWAETPAQALREAAAMLGMDTDPYTQTYTLTLEAVPLTTAELEG
jgi:hypothetical protein